MRAKGQVRTCHYGDGNDGDGNDGDGNDGDGSDGNDGDGNDGDGDHSDHLAMATTAAMAPTITAYARRATGSTMIQRPPVEQIALWADRLRDISALGLLFTQDNYDRERYEQIQDLALEMLALAVGELPEVVEPLRGPIFSRPTPLAGGDGAVINERGELLLMRRADNKRWAMPGGALMVGETPAEGAAREVFEETGVRCAPVALVAVHDSRRLPAPSRFQLYMFTFLCRPLEGGWSETPSHSNETIEIGWFTEDNLPVDLDPRHATRIPEAFRVWHGDQRAFFDGTE